MREKKQTIAAFKRLLKSSANVNWDSVRQKLGPQELTGSRKTARRFKPAVAAVLSFFLVAAIGTAAALSLGRSVPVTAPVQSAKSAPTAVSGAPSKRPAADFGSSAAGKVLSQGAANGPAVPAEPFFLHYQNLIFINRSVYGNNTGVRSGGLIGYVNFGGSVPVRAVSGEDTKSAICLLSTYMKSASGKTPDVYLRFSFLCSDSFTVRGNFYRITDVLNVTPSNGGYESAVGTDGYLISRSFPGSFPSEPQIIKSILLGRIGGLQTGGDVYAIDEIDPSQAVYLNIADNWLLVKKAKDYSGKTVEDVMKDKGIKTILCN